MIRVAHVITTLDVGGAEVALSRLLSRTDPGRFDAQVISLKPAGDIGATIRDQGWQVRSVDMSGAASLPVAMTRLHRWLRADRPDVVQTWLYHADVLAGVVARAARVPAVSWSLRSSDFEPGAWRRSTVAMARVAARLSGRVPDVVICGSQAARRFHEELGYRSDRMVVIPNGFDVPSTDRAGREAARARLREELGLPETAVVMVRVARLHPHKDHRTLLAAFGIAAASCPDLHLVLVGQGVDPGNAAIAESVAATGAPRRVHLLGERGDVDAIHAGADLAVSSSIGEGFPNVVAEAMAAGVPVVATDVGDSALLVADTGRIVPSRDPAALAAALLELASLSADERAALGTRARQRVQDHFSLDRTAGAHADLYESLVARVRH